MLKTYKYRTGPSALRTLSEASLYFASAEKLNDILEAKFDTVDDSRFYSEFYSAFEELASQRKVPVNLISKSSILEELIEITSIENSNLKKSCERAGIFSTSIRPDNQPLWAYYANNFRGVCFEFEWPTPFLERNQIIPMHINYSEKQRIINRAIDAKQLLMEIGEKNPDWSLDEIKSYSLSEEFRKRWGIMTTVRAISTKHLDWQHEEEIRFIAPRIINLPIYGLLKRVFFVKEDFSEYISIIRLLHQLYPEVEIVRLKFSHAEPIVSAQVLDLKKIPIDEVNSS